MRTVPRWIIRVDRCEKQLSCFLGTVVLTKKYLGSTRKANCILMLMFTWWALKAEATKMGDQWLQSWSLLPGNLDCCYFLFFFLVLWLFFFLSSVYQVFSMAKLFTRVFSFQSLRVSSLCVKAFYLHWLESLFKTRKTKLKK
jgi:hypothetical protein